MVSSGLLQEPHGVTTQRTPFFIVTAVKTSNLTKHKLFHIKQILRPSFVCVLYFILLMLGISRLSKKSTGQWMGGLIKEAMRGA
jgi:hypothetical protein